PAPAAVPAEADVPAGAAVPVGRTGLVAGAGLYLIRPYFQNNPAYTVWVEHTRDTVLDPTKPRTETVAEQADRVSVSSHVSAAPLVWLGYVGEDGLGGRVRWWGFRQGTSQTVFLPPFAGAFKVGKKAGHDVIVASGDLYTVTSAAPLGLMAF